MKEKKDIFKLLTEYASQENIEKTKSEREYTAYGMCGIDWLTEGECCLFSFCGWLCAGCCLL